MNSLKPIDLFIRFALIVCYAISMITLFLYEHANYWHQFWDTAANLLLIWSLLFVKDDVNSKIDHCNLRWFNIGMLATYLYLDMIGYFHLTVVTIYYMVINIIYIIWALIHNAPIGYASYLAQRYLKLVGNCIVVVSGFLIFRLV